MTNGASRWRLPLLLGGLFTLLLGVTLISVLMSQGGASRAESLNNRSVYNDGPSGYKAWHTAMQRAGIQTRPWRQDFEHLPEAGPAVMVIIEPYAVSGQSVVFSKEQIARLLKWVRTGHTLILLDDFERYNDLSSRLVLEALKVGRVRASGNHELDRPLRWVGERDPLLAAFIDRPLKSRIPSTLHTAASPHPIQPLLKSDDGLTVLLPTRFGQGRLVLGTVPDLASNRLLADTGVDNYQFFANLLSREDGPIYINEYVHGYSEITDLLDYYRAKTPLEPLALQLSLIFLAVLWLSALPPRMRLANPEALPAPDALGFLGAMAGIYERTRSASLALGPQMNQLESLLRRYYRMDLTQRERLGDLLKARSEEYSGKERRKTPRDAATLMAALETAANAVRDERKLPPAEVLRLSRQLMLIQERLFDGHSVR